MPAGLLASRNLLQNVTQPVYINNTNNGIIISVNICNRNDFPITFALAISAELNPIDYEWIEFGTAVIDKSQFDRTQIFLGPGEYVTAIASANNVGIQVMGLGFGTDIPEPVLIEDTEADGSSPLQAATSAAAIKTLTGTNIDGVYWIKASPSAPAQQVYCIMDSTWDGGGWMVVANNSAASPTGTSAHVPRLTSRDSYVGSSGLNSTSRTNNFSINVRDYAITKLAVCARQPLGTYKDIYAYVYGTFNTATTIPSSTSYTRKFDNYHQQLPWLIVPDIRLRSAYTTDPTGLPTSAFSAIVLYDGQRGDTSFANPGWHPVTTLGVTGNISVSGSTVVTSNDNNAYGVNGMFSFAGGNTATTTATASAEGWDDWQDGNGLSDAWGIAGTPNYGRGYPAFIMVK
jgi:hypothetical protein